jgi:hypothetical protein
LIGRIRGRSGKKADPSTPFDANSPNSAQDDIIMVVLYVDTTYAKQGQQRYDFPLYSMDAPWRLFRFGAFFCKTNGHPLLDARFVFRSGFQFTAGSNGTR